MRKITINGKEITTNLRTAEDRYNDRDYQILTEDRDTMVYKRPQWISTPEGGGYFETDVMMFDRLVEEGYARITFYRTTTSVRGYHKLIAYCK